MRKTVWTVAIRVFQNIFAGAHILSRENQGGTVFGPIIWSPLILMILVQKWTSLFDHMIICLRIVRQVANNADPDQTPRSAASDLGLHCLVRPVCPHILG